MHYFIVAGEASGDLHAANLMKEIKKLDNDARFSFYGGNKMLEAGGTLLVHYKTIAFMGFVQVLLHLKTILKTISRCKQDIQRLKPDHLILVDYPGFNLRMAQFGHSIQLPVHYYITPKVWAWKTKRVYKIKKYVNQILTILPFEPIFFEQYEIPANYVGNPLLDAIDAYKRQSQLVSETNHQNKNIVALLPGSRKQEIKKLLPEMCLTASKFKDYTFKVAVAPNIPIELYKSIVGKEINNIELFHKGTYTLLEQSTAALVTSGTATLETALFSVPQVVLYKMEFGALANRLKKYFLKTKWFSLVNLIEDRLVVKELFQKECTPDSIGNELSKILFDKEYRLQMLDNYEKLHVTMGKPGASKKAAERIFNYKA